MSEIHIAHGLEGVVMGKTRLSEVDGQAGRLLIAGLPVEELAPNATYEEAAFLLWHDRLPTASELDELQSEMARQRDVPPITVQVLRAAAEAKVHPMDALRLGADTLSLIDPMPGVSSREANLKRAISLISHFPTIIAYYWRMLHGQEPVPPNSKLGHVENFLYMMSGETPHPDKVRGLQTYLVTVIDHGMNNSTFTARVIISTQSDMYSAVVGAVGALKGPLHGGAPGPALDMVFDIRARAAKSGRSVAEEAAEWAREALASGHKIMGFGHRVYKVRDPRADVLAAAAEVLFAGAGDAQLYDDARTAEGAFLRALDEFKPGAKIKTNVEFYTALVLHGVGLESKIFSSIFAMSRVGGWTAHIMEQIEEDTLIRPLVHYTGATGRRWVPLEQRG